MKHKLLQSLMLIAVLLTSTHANAHDFEAKNSDGVTIYYKITSSSDKTCEVTYAGDSYNSYSNEYTGSIVIPETVTYNGTTYSVTTIGDSAFYGCSGLSSVTIPNSVTIIGQGAFYDCASLTSVTIPNSVTRIYADAFKNCTSLTSVTIPNRVTFIGNRAFDGCSGLTTIKVETGNSKYDSRNNCNAIIETSTNKLITGCKNTTIPNSVNSIGDYAFSGCTSLTSITIPNSVTSIGDYAFSGCTSLTSITIPNSVTSIGMWAFSGCSSLTSVTIGNSVTSIGVSAFYGCSGLSSVTIPNSVTSIGDYAFYGCSGLTSIEIPNSVTSIGDYAFSYCSGLTSIEIPNSVTSISIGAFYKCTGLTSITIPNSVTSIGSSAFYDCRGLTSITIPNSVTSIGFSAFYYCSSLTSVNISDLEAWCKIDFNNSYSNPLYYAKKLYLNGELLTGLIIPDSIKEIKNYAFSGCSGLTSVTVPNSVTSIGGFAFYYCTGLTTIKVETGNSKYDSRNNCNAIIETSTNTLIAGCKNTIIPNGVTSIGDGAFSGCRGLTSVTIPNSVTSIGDDAFCYCSGLISVISLNPIPPTCESVAFAYVSVGNITLEVPAESVSLYQSADTWKDFGTIKGIAGSSALTYNILNETDVEVTGGTEKYTGDIVIPSQTSIDGKVYNVTKVRHYAFYEGNNIAVYPNI